MPLSIQIRRVHDHHPTWKNKATQRWNPKSTSTHQKGRGPKSNSYESFICIHLCAVHSVILYVICDIFTEQSCKIHINEGTTSKQLAWFKTLLTGGCLIQCSVPSMSLLRQSGCKNKGHGSANLTGVQRHQAPHSKTWNSYEWEFPIDDAESESRRKAVDNDPIVIEPFVFAWATRLLPNKDPRCFTTKQILNGYPPASQEELAPVQPTKARVNCNFCRLSFCWLMGTNQNRKQCKGHLSNLPCGQSKEHHLAPLAQGTAILCCKGPP